jgi:hypothetical protein
MHCRSYTTVTASTLRIGAVTFWNDPAGHSPCCRTLRKFFLGDFLFVTNNTCLQNKLQQFNINDGGIIMDSVAAKLDTAFTHIISARPEPPFTLEDIRVC